MSARSWGHTNNSSTWGQKNGNTNNYSGGARQSQALTNDASPIYGTAAKEGQYFTRRHKSETNLNKRLVDRHRGQSGRHTKQKIPLNNNYNIEPEERFKRNTRGLQSMPNYARTNGTDDTPRRSERNSKEEEDETLQDYVRRKRTSSTGSVGIYKTKSTPQLAGATPTAIAFSRPTIKKSK